MSRTESSNVVIFSRNNFPEGDAGSVRDLSFAKIYMELGYNVFCICLNDKSEYGIFDDVEYFSIWVKKNSFFEKVNAEFNYSKRMQNILSKIHLLPGSNIIFHIVDIPFNAIQYLKKYSYNIGAKLIHDSVEWYSPSNFKHGLLSIGFLQKELLNRYIISKRFSVIAISTYLQNYFSHKNINTIRIPVIMDIQTKAFYERSDRRNIINLIYAGSPGKKDNIVDIFNAFNLLYLEGVGSKFVFHLVGVSKENLLAYPGISEKSILFQGNSLKIYGRISRQEVLNLYTSMDFSILIRPSERRYAKAGFPTKIVESLSYSVPVICNYSSDLDKYLFDNDNAIIISEVNIQSISQSLKNAILCNHEQLIRMKKRAFETSKLYFDYRNYVLSVNKMIKQ